MSECNHDYTYSGVRYKIGDKVAGSGSHYVLYCESFFCRHCLARRYVALGVTGNSYDKIMFDAVPIETGGVIE